MLDLRDVYLKISVSKSSGSGFRRVQRGLDRRSVRSHRRLNLIVDRHSIVPSIPSLSTRSPLLSSHRSHLLSFQTSLHLFSQNPGTVPPKKDRNVEKTRTCTLSAAKGRAPGPMLTEEEPIIPDGSFFPLNLNPPGDDHANPSESE